MTRRLRYAKRLLAKAEDAWNARDHRTFERVGRELAELGYCVVVRTDRSTEDVFAERHDLLMIVDSHDPENNWPWDPGHPVRLFLD